MSDAIDPCMPMSDLLASTLMPRTDTWEGARQLYIWEQHALCYLHQRRGDRPPINGWTAILLEFGYPPKGSSKGRDWMPGDKPYK